MGRLGMLAIDAPPTMPFGKYRGMLLEEISSSAYLWWLVLKADRIDDDLRAEVEAELARRRAKIPGELLYVTKGASLVHISMNQEPPECGTLALGWRRRQSEKFSKTWPGGKECPRCFS